MAQGSITRIVNDRGFGFIKPQEGGDDVFFHHSSVNNNGFDYLAEGQQVDYDLGRDQRSNKIRAENVRTN
jgi:cold shock protein